MIITSEAAQSDWLDWTGVETVFAGGFQALDVAHVFGKFRDADQVITALVQGVAFSVTLAPDGTVTAFPLGGMPVAHGQVRFYRVTPATKDVDFIDLGNYSAEVHDRLYAADALRMAEARRDMAAGGVTVIGGGGETTADLVSYPGAAAGLSATTAREALDQLAARKLSGLPDVAMPVLNVTVDQYRVTWDNASQRFVLAPGTGGADTGAAIVAKINTELGGTGWQAAGGGGGGTITAGSNVGTGGELGIYKAASGAQLQFYGVRGINGVAAALNAGLNGIDFSLDTTFGDARYVKPAQLDDVAFNGLYSSLAGTPLLGGLAAKDTIGFTDIAAAAIASLLEAQTGTAADKLMTAQRVAQAIAALAIASSRQITAGAGLTGGGDLSADRTIDLGSPLTVTGSSINAANTSTHSHAWTGTALDVLPAARGDAGSYAFLANLSTTVTWTGGSTIAGSSLQYARISSAGAGVASGSSPSGTWRNMGHTLSVSVGGTFGIGVGVRTA